MVAPAREGEAAAPAGAGIAFGPIPSRRLGRSLGINNIPAKHCSFSCVYCQVGPTPATEVEPREFIPPEAIHDAVGARLAALAREGEDVDYLTFVPDGEPTLDRNLARAIELLRPFGHRIAVISNATLAWRPEVRAALARADWLSLKVDAVDEGVWRRVNRPDPRLDLARILDGVRDLAAGYAGTLTTETMLVAGVNDGAESIAAVAAFLAGVRPATAYLMAPIRPPAETWVRPPGEAVFTRAHEIFAARLPRVECLIGDEPAAFAYSGRVESDLLGVAAVHPLREDAVRALLARAGADWSVVERLLAEGRLRRTEYRGRAFYIRRLGEGEPPPTS